MSLHIIIDLLVSSMCITCRLYLDLRFNIISCVTSDSKM